MTTNYSLDTHVLMKVTKKNYESCPLLIKKIRTSQRHLFFLSIFSIYSIYVLNSKRKIRRKFESKFANKLKAIMTRRKEKKKLFQCLSSKNFNIKRKISLIRVSFTEFIHVFNFTLKTL